MSIRLKREMLALPRAPEPDLEIFAFGDIHGRSDLLGALMDAAAREPKRASRRAVVFLGDLIDRGPDSLGAIALAATAAESLGADEVVRLMGNHEQLMRMALTGETPEAAAREAFAVWRGNGGEHVIAEFPGLRVVSSDSGALLLSAREALPAAAKDYLMSLQPHWRSGSVLFVHAGVNPAQPLETALAAPWDVPLHELDQDAHWAWIRAPFLDYQPGEEGRGGYLVVHGHTPNDGRRKTSHADQLRGFRLNLDGGSGFTGTCRMAILRGGWVEVVSATGPRNRELAG